MIVPSRWVRFWLLFSYYKVGDPPGPIDMLSLIKQDRSAPGGWRAKKSLLAPSNKFGEERPGHYRRISLEAWVHLVDLYGVDGYALAVVQCFLRYFLFYPNSLIFLSSEEHRMKTRLDGEFSKIQRE